MRRWKLIKQTRILRIAQILRRARRLRGALSISEVMNSTHQCPLFDSAGITIAA
jgi:hypothetical protein